MRKVSSLLSLGSSGGIARRGRDTIFYHRCGMHIRVDIKLLYHGIKYILYIYIKLTHLNHVYILYRYIILLYVSSRPVAPGRRTTIYMYIKYIIFMCMVHIYIYLYAYNNIRTWRRVTTAQRSDQWTCPPYFFYFYFINISFYTHWHR